MQEQQKNKSLKEKI